jgi:CRP-like cAMP-binding protein
MEALLQSVPLFASIDDKCRRVLLRGCREIDVPRGSVIHGAGEMASGIYALVSGRVKLAIPAAHGSEKVIELLGPGDTFGQSATFLGAPHIASAETLTPARLLHVDRSAVLTAVRRHHQFAERILIALSARLRHFIREIASAALHSGTERTIAFLLAQLPREAHGCTMLMLPARKRVIASRLDLTHEHFSRILRDLSAARLIIVEGAKLTIPDVERLRSSAEG